VYTFVGTNQITQPVGMCTYSIGFISIHISWYFLFDCTRTNYYTVHVGRLTWDLYLSMLLQYETGSCENITRKTDSQRSCFRYKEIFICTCVKTSCRKRWIRDTQNTVRHLVYTYLFNCFETLIAYAYVLSFFSYDNSQIDFVLFIELIYLT
jgi:hypothetical protein